MAGTGNRTFRPFVSSPHWTYSTFPAYSVKTQACITVPCERCAARCFMTPTEIKAMMMNGEDKNMTNVSEKNGMPENRRPPYNTSQDCHGPVRCFVTPFSYTGPAVCPVMVYGFHAYPRKNYTIRYTDHILRYCHKVMT